MSYDFDRNPRSWQFTGEIKMVRPNTISWFHTPPALEYQMIFEKRVFQSDTEFEIIRIGVTVDKGRIKISDPPAGESPGERRNV